MQSFDKKSRTIPMNAKIIPVMQMGIPCDTIRFFPPKISAKKFRMKKIGTDAATEKIKIFSA
jgi:hypothetical protein